MLFIPQDVIAEHLVAKLEEMECVRYCALGRTGEIRIQGNNMCWLYCYLDEKDVHIPLQNHTRIARFSYGDPDLFKKITESVRKIIEREITE